MQTFTGWEYLLIDLANAFGHDKMLFQERIDWATARLNDLEGLTGQAESKPLYVKATLAIRKAQAGMPTGHLVGFDACCSGIQIMSTLTGCVAGATATGLVDPNVRADAYGQLRDVMADRLGGTVDISRRAAKDALMTSFYGSKKRPREIFGAETPELHAFYQSAYQIAPGAWELLQDLLASWRPWAKVHAWKLPDGFDARVKVMVKKEARIEVDELDHATFTYEFYENEGTEEGLSNVANVVHSVDAYVLRCIHRRCNYDQLMVERALGAINFELACRANPCAEIALEAPSEMVSYYIEQYKRSGMADIVILPHLKGRETIHLDVDHLNKLKIIIESMLVHRPFPVITVHDEFKCHANNMNHLRQHYINIFAELAEAHVLQDIMSQLYQTQCPNVKLSQNLGALIRNSNYALS